MLKLTIIRNEEKITEEEVKEVKVNTENGTVTILPQHQPYMAKILKNVSYTPSSEDAISIAISSGFIYTDGEKCIAVVDE